MSSPFMQLYVADYLGDTRHLTTEQHGAYLLLLMTMWRADGELPADDTRLARIAGLSVARWNKIKGDVVALMCIEDGKLTQKRLRAELEKAKEKSHKRADAGRRGGLSKPLKDQEQNEAIASVLLKHSSEPEPDIIKKEEPVRARSADADAPQSQAHAVSRETSGTEQIEIPSFLDRRVTGGAIVATGFLGDAAQVQTPTQILNAAYAAYDETRQRAGWPAVQMRTGARDAALRGRLKEAGGLDGWLAALEKAEGSDFCCGRAPPTPPRTKAFMADFDFLTQQSSFVKLMEGKYDNRGGPQRPSQDGNIGIAARVAARRAAARSDGNLPN